MRTIKALKGVAGCAAEGRRGGRHTAWHRLLAGLLVACLGWSSGLMPVAAAAAGGRHEPAPGAPMASGHRASLPLFPYGRMAARALPPRPAAGPAAVTLLDSVGGLHGPATAAQPAAWRAELHRPGLSPRRSAQLQIWLGEWALAHDQQPVPAQARFARARRSVPVGDPLSGLAAYDTAVALYQEGAYGDAAAAFAGLFGRGAQSGYDPRAAALWLRMARACAGYHAARAKQGIPEPPRLDPLCGAAALAACLHARGLPSDRTSVLRACRVTGEGSTLDDLMRAGPRLGVDVEALNADEAGLEALPKPAVAFVEHDHFLAVVRADRRGVAYLCSDCGPWPGGEVDLTWRQWRLLDPGLYVAVTRPGSADQRRVAQALRLPSWAPGFNVASADGVAPPSPVLVSMRGGLSSLHLGVHAGPGPSLLGHVARLIPSGGITCGQKPSTLQGNCLSSMPTDTGTPGSDPVNLANGEEEFTPGPDLVVPNPIGPPVVWQRIYDSLRPTGAGYNPGDATDEDYDYGVGWTQNYNVGVYDPSGGTGTGDTKPKYIYFPNGARLGFFAPSMPTSKTATVYCTVQTGVPARVTWNYGSAGDYFVVTFKNRATWTTRPLNTATDPTSGGPIDCAPLATITDRNLNVLNFTYGATVNGWNLLTGIVNGSGTTLLTINRSASGAVTSVADDNGRSILYSVQPVKTVDPYNESNPYFQELEHVSQVVPSGTTSAADSEQYGYTNIANGDLTEAMPFLTTISEPSPDGQTEPAGSPYTGMSTATINYAGTTGYVTSLVDAKGNTHTYTAVDGTDTQVTVANADGTVADTYTVSFNASMQWLSTKRGDKTVLFTADYPSGAPDPFQPYKLTDGVGGTWYYTWDRYGNLMRADTPYNTQIDLVWAFPSGNDPAEYVPAPANQPSLGPLTAGYDSGTINTTYTSDTGCPMGELHSMTETAETTNTVKEATTYTYDAHGNLTQMTAPQPDQVSGPGGPGVSSKSSVTDYFNYDSHGQLIAVTEPGPSTSGPSSEVTTTFGYGGSTEFGVPTSATDPLNYTANYAYDGQGDLMSVRDASNYETDFTYNLAGQPLTATLPATGQTGPGRAYTQVDYLYPGGPATGATSFDESRSPVRTASFAYSATGELAGEGGAAEPLTATYDALHRPLTVADGNGNVTTYTYDPNSGGLSTVRYPGAAAGAATGYDVTTLAGYNGNGDPTVVTDGRGVSTIYSYNGPGGAMDSATTSSAGPVTPRSLNLTFDGFGRVSGVVDSASGVSHTYTYDDDDELRTSTTAYSGGPSDGLFYYYYPDGSRETLTLTLSGSGNFNYAYDADGRLTSLTNPYGQTSGWSYQPNGWPAGQSLSSGAGSNINTGYTYNGAGELTDLVTTDSVTNSVAGVLAHYGPIGYNGAGQITSLPQNTSGGLSPTFTTSYGYDGRGRLSQETNSPAAYPALGAITYDGAGNLSPPPSGPPYNNDNQSVADAYDGAGDPTSSLGRAGAFDALGQMTAFGPPQSGPQLTAGYDPSGQRAWKQSARTGGRVYTFYDGSSPLAEVTGNGTPVSVDTFGALGLVSTQTGAGTTLYDFDPRGDVAQRVAGSGPSLPPADVYGPYGELLSGNSGGDEFGFGGQAGYRTDAETGLCLLGQRYYDPHAGRFLTRDPAGDAGGLDLYAYCGGDPVNHLDPSGLDDGDSILPDNVDTGSGWADMEDFQDKGMAQAGYNAGSFLAHAAPGIGTLLSLNDAVTGCDVVSNSSLSTGQRAMARVNVALAALPLLGMFGREARYVQITHWNTPEEIAAMKAAGKIKPGVFVIVGGPSTFNWIRTGIADIFPGGKYAFKDHMTDYVPSTHLSWPRLPEWINGLFFGHRIYNP